MDLRCPEYVNGHALLAQKSVLITAAAGSGIGFAVAEKVLQERARAVLISDAHKPRLARAVERLRQNFPGQKVYAKPCDVRSEEQVRALIDQSESSLQGTDVLINNAGLGVACPLVDMEEEQWMDTLDVTLNGTMRAMRHMMIRMRDRGRGGVIVNNASVLGWRAQKNQCHYAAAKAGVMALTRCAALEAVPWNIRINAIAPSLVVHQKLHRSISEAALAHLSAAEAYSRSAKPWEIANIIVFLASDYASYLTGEVISASSQRA